MPSSFKEQEKGIEQIRLRGGDGEVMEALAGYGKAVILCSEMGGIRAFWTGLDVTQAIWWVRLLGGRRL